MRRSLLANLAALALFAALAQYTNLWSWKVLLFQLVVQALANEFWADALCYPFGGQLPPGTERRRMVRRSCICLLALPALAFAALAYINHWGEGALGQGLHLPLGGALLLSSLAAQGLLFATSLAWGLLPLSTITLLEAGAAPPEDSAGAVPAPPPTRAGVEMLPHGLPVGLHLPTCLQEPQHCSPLHARHAELVRARLREGELAILSTAPAGRVSLPSSSNERLLGGALLCLAALLLYTAIGLFEPSSTRLVTRWVVLVLGLGLLPTSLRVLRAASHRQALLLSTDYFITNQRLHICRAGRWEAVALVSMEVIPGGSYGEGREDVLLCPESGAEAYTLVNVEHAEELAQLLERLVLMENAR